MKESNEFELVSSNKYMYAVEGNGHYIIPEEDENVDRRFRRLCRAALVEVGIMGIEGFKYDFERFNKEEKTVNHSLHFTSAEAAVGLLGKLIFYFQGEPEGIKLYTTADGSVRVEKDMPSGAVTKVIYTGYDG